MSLRVNFPTQLPSQWSTNMVKLQALRLNQCFGPFTMSLVEGSSQTGACRRLSNHVFGVRNFENTEAMSVIFFWKCSKCNADLKTAWKNSEKMFCFWVKCMRIICIELSLLIRESLSSAVNVLAKSLKTFAVTKSYFSNSITFRVINQYGKGAGVKTESVFLPVYHVACWGVLSNRSF